MALDILQKKGVAAAAVSHTSARIGDAADMWENGVIAHVNPLAAAIGLKRGDGVQAALRRVIG
ncbi:MAG: hypothetical protein ACT4N4_17300 [Rhodospirillales bacterium]